MAIELLAVQDPGEVLAARACPGQPVLARLEAHPRALLALAARGVDLGARAQESDETLENRLGTELMTLYRDTRDPECFAALYDFARPALQRWILSLLRRNVAALDANEVLQDTFVNVYRYCASFREEHSGSFRVWVRTIAGNLVRRGGTRASGLLVQELPKGANEPADASAGPDRAADSSEQFEKLGEAWRIFLALYARAYGELGARDQQALELVEVRGLGYQQAGELLGVGRSNMKMIVFRSRRRIAARMRSALATRCGARALRRAG